MYQEEEEPEVSRNSSSSINCQIGPVNMLKHSIFSLKQYNSMYINPVHYCVPKVCTMHTNEVEQIVTFKYWGKTYCFKNKMRAIKLNTELRMQTATWTDV